MFIDSNTIDNKREFKADICIIGGGVAGIAAAKDFLNGNQDVIILESGGEYPDNKTQTLTTGRNSGLEYYDLETTRTRAFGGTSLTWTIDLNKDEEIGVRLREMDRIDFEERDWIPNSGWPITKKELDPYYEKANQFCKIGPHNYDVNHWEDKSETPRLRFKDNSVETAIFQFANREVFYKDYKEEISQSSNLKFFLNATVLKINLTESVSQVENVIAINRNGQKFTVKANYFMVSVGGLETPRLLLLSNDQMKSGIGNQNDLVGRYFMEHPHLWSGVFYPSNPSLYKKLALYSIHHRHRIPIMGKWVLPEKTLRSEKLMNCAMSIHYEPNLKKKKSLKSFNKLRKNLFRLKLDGDTKKAFKKLVKESDTLLNIVKDKLIVHERKLDRNHDVKYDGFKLNIMSEQLPDPDSRVELDTIRDMYDQPKLKLHWKLNPFDIRNIRRYQEIIDAELRKNNHGVLDIELKGNEIPGDIHGGWHHMGTTRMHRRPEKGVVDENCKVHGVENLYIAGSSVFPTGGYANPTLTLIALTLRLTDHIKKISKRSVSKVKKN